MSDALLEKVQSNQSTGDVGQCVELCAGSFRIIGNFKHILVHEHTTTLLFCPAQHNTTVVPSQIISGVTKTITRQGAGYVPPVGCKATVHYVGTLEDGTVVSVCLKCLVYHSSGFACLQTAHSRIACEHSSTRARAAVPLHFAWAEVCQGALLHWPVISHASRLILPNAHRRCDQRLGCGSGHYAAGREGDCGVPARVRVRQKVKRIEWMNVANAMQG